MCITDLHCEQLRRVAFLWEARTSQSRLRGALKGARGLELSSQLTDGLVPTGQCLLELLDLQRRTQRSILNAGKRIARVRSRVEQTTLMFAEPHYSYVKQKWFEIKCLSLQLGRIVLRLLQVDPQFGDGLEARVGSRRTKGLQARLEYPVLQAKQGHSKSALSPKLSQFPALKHDFRELVCVLCMWNLGSQQRDFLFVALELLLVCWAASRVSRTLLLQRRFELEDTLIQHSSYPLNLRKYSPFPLFCRCSIL